MLSTKFFDIVIVLVSIIVYINCQPCQNASLYDSCSINRECGCLKLPWMDDFSVCGLLSLSCFQMSPCQSPGNTCQQSEHICVNHPNCDSRPLCYPLSMIGERVCPSIEATTESQIRISNYSSALTSEDALYSRPGGSTNTYYEAIQLIVPRTGYYDITSLSTMDTHGYLYNGSFYPSNPQLNQIAHNDDGSANNQFKLPVFLEAGVPYTLVVTTHNSLTTGPFSVVASGPDNIYFSPINLVTTTTSTQPPIITSSYSNVLTLNSAKFDRTGNSSSVYYYQAYQLRVSRTGNYTFTSSSGMDTYGYIYQGNFYPTFPYFNIHKQDDDGAGSGQFKLTAELRSDITYILVVTTFSQTTTGTFSITASGPAYVNLIPI